MKGYVVEKTFGIFNNLKSTTFILRLKERQMTKGSLIKRRNEVKNLELPSPFSKLTDIAIEILCTEGQKDVGERKQSVELVKLSVLVNKKYPKYENKSSKFWIIPVQLSTNQFWVFNPNRKTSRRIVIYYKCGNVI